MNTSATLAAALEAIAPGGRPLRLHLSTPVPGSDPDDGLWMVELRVPAGPGSLPFTAGRRGWRLALPGGGHARLLRGGPAALGRRGIDLPVGLFAHLEAHGRPIRYAYAGADWPMNDYQTVFATHRGSAEMPSAGRAFTHELVTALVAAGRRDRADPAAHRASRRRRRGSRRSPSRWVPAATARHVNLVRASGGRAIAVGTTAVRALESAAGGGPDRRSRPRAAPTS